MRIIYVTLLNHYLPTTIFIILLPMAQKIYIHCSLHNYFITVDWTFSTSTQSSTGSDLAHRAPTSDVRTWYDDINSPLIQEDGNTKSLKLRFDVSQYAPEEIVVKTVDNKLLVSKRCFVPFVIVEIHFTILNI